MASKRKRTTSSSLQTCTICGAEMHSRGMGSHRKKCERERDEAEETRRRLRATQIELGLAAAASDLLDRSLSVSQPPSPAAMPADVEEGQRSSPLPPHDDTPPGIDDHHVYFADGVDDPATLDAKVDDIKVEYHPHSKRPPAVTPFDNFSRRSPLPEALNEPSAPLKTPPWSPFRTRLDFEVASFALDAGLKEEHVNMLLSLLGRCTKGDEQLTLGSSEDINHLWDLAAHRAPEFVQDTIEVEYRGQEVEFEIWYRPLWDWVLSLVKDTNLASHFEWNSQRLYKFNGRDFIRFFDEPWTGDLLWNMESQLPEDGTPFFYIVYADKSKLSSFGTTKAYPVIVRCANLYTSVRNGRGIGGGEVVGWLPVIEEDSGETRKKNYVTMKNTDYEEACVMTAIRGIKGLYPCPVCLVPQDKQGDHTEIYDLRSTESMQEIFEDARSQTTREAEEGLLKAVSLRPIQNVFWTLNLSDPYKAVSFDTLHTFDNGLFEDHLYVQLLEHIKALGRPAVVKLDTQIAAIPPWRGLNHFNTVSTISFNDGSKNHDISKIILFACHNILTKEEDEVGYLLLRCLRAYMNMRMYAGLRLHTEETISAGREAVEEFSALLQEYIEESNEEALLAKNWNFPKNHLYMHLFDDIVAKGVTRNYSTKPNEQMHGPLRRTYQRTNFRNIAPQILTKIHRVLVAEYLWQDIDNDDSAIAAAKEDTEVDIDKGKTKSSTTASYYSDHLSLTVAQPSITFHELEQQHAADRAPKLFNNFHVRLADFLSTSLPLHQLPNQQRVRYRPQDVVNF
ncbi:hypothetical protein CCMSSC00406_0009505 [Pleurotus cornucopiae]|uniref:Uncharacterized protein n=3 Tax=Pleurotus cornucopiae TaxID=5321 RepID=A0ACB7IQK6_PLECO|nr:hypothetical protein CCMSSC00406_0008183 [Pleurotus cornucopiae]KAG9219808.1 hypothetical protein CCMSSC00406_0010339 [Pleurotus cornucopiae]KAG9219902.1 hypothetical protein CCMSSC00406_0009505 [Pleurotus cornucopiae]